MAYEISIINQNLKGIAHLKDCHALEKFKIEMDMAGSIFEPRPSNFGKSDII